MSIEKIKNEEDKKALYMQEYTEACLNVRHYSSLQFAMFTVFFAVLGGLMMISFNIKVSIENKYLIIAVKIAGLLITYVFWTYYEKIRFSFWRYRIRAGEIEKLLDYHLFTSQFSFKLWFPRISIVTRLLYGTICIFWLIALILELINL